MHVIVVRVKFVPPVQWRSIEKKSPTSGAIWKHHSEGTPKKKSHFKDSLKFSRCSTRLRTFRTHFAAILIHIRPLLGSLKSQNFIQRDKNWEGKVEFSLETRVDNFVVFVWVIVDNKPLILYFSHDLDWKLEKDNVFFLFCPRWGCFSLRPIDFPGINSLLVHDPIKSRVSKGLTRNW